MIYNYVEDYDAAKHDIVIDPASSGDTKIIGTGFPGDTIVFTDSSGEKSVKVSLIQMEITTLH